MKSASKPVAIITGAGRGIGLAVANLLADNGYTVVLSARTQSEIVRAAEAIQARGGTALAIRADVAVESDVSNLANAAIETYGRIDLLVNNAGIGVFSPVLDFPLEGFDRMFATNVRGVFLCSKSVLPSMIARQRGDIVNIASLAGRNSFKGGAGYSATKWALIGFARSLMLEVRDKNIRVITICPGSVDTGFDPKSAAKDNRDRIPKAEDIAKIVLDAVSMPRNVMVSEIDVRPTNP